MKRKEAIEKIKALWPKDAVHCPTEKEAKEFLQLMYESWRYRTGKNTNMVFWNKFKEETCYDYSWFDIEYSNYDRFKERWYKIHKASNFLGWEEEVEKYTYNIDASKDNQLIKTKIEKATIHPGTYKQTNLQDVLDDTPDWWVATVNIAPDNIQVDINLHSTVNQMWAKVTQEIHFVCWSVRTVDGIITNLIEQWRYTILTTDKAERKIHTKNVNYVIVKWDSNNTPSWTCQTLIFHFTNDNKLTRKDMSDYNKIWEMIKYKCTNWDMILINNTNLNAIEEIK